MKRLLLILALLVTPCRGGVEFDGVDDYINVGDINQCETEPFTVSLWMFAFTTNDMAMWANAKPSGTGPSTDAFALDIAGGKLGARAQRGSGAGSARDASTVTTNAWVHVCGVFGSDTSRILYVNGSSVATNTASEPVSAGSAQMRIGSSIDNNATHLPFLGRISEVHIYSSALSAEEVAQLASSRLKGPILQTSALVGRWPLDDVADGGSGSGATYLDRAGTGNGTGTSGTTGRAETHLSYP